MATEQELQSLFDTLDRDQNGKVSINELFSIQYCSVKRDAMNRRQDERPIICRNGDLSRLCDL